jgi:hypothetical protein
LNLLDQEEFEDINVAMRIHKSKKNRQNYVEKKNEPHGKSACTQVPRKRSSSPTSTNGTRLKVPTAVLEHLQFQRYDRLKGTTIFKFNFNELKFNIDPT